LKPKLRELLLASFQFDDYSPLYTKVLLLNALLFISSVMNFLFVSIQLAIVHNYQIAFVNFMILLFSLIALYILREKHNHKLASYIGNAVLFVSFIAIIILLQGKSYTLIWSYFFAPFAIITLGAARGLVLSALFLTITFALVYSGIDVWLDGTWGPHSYLRFVLAHFLMLYIMYAIQNSQERAHEKIAELRQHEKEQLQLFEKLSITDSLTSLYNRRFLVEIFARQLNSAKRNHKVFAFFILDLDYFKQFNDTYGHQKGDAALQEIAKLLKQKLKRSDDYAFRMGGEEFAGILLADNKHGIQEQLIQIHKACSTLNIPHAGSQVSDVLTASIGVCMVEQSGDRPFNELYKHADEALYKAKASGRNQIAYAECLT